MPLPGGTTLVVLDDWAVAAAQGDTSQSGQMYVASATPLLNYPNVAVEIADQVMVGPVIGPPGLVFVDGSGRLLAVSTHDLHATWAAGQQP